MPVFRRQTQFNSFPPKFGPNLPCDTSQSINSIHHLLSRVQTSLVATGITPAAALQYHHYIGTPEIDYLVRSHADSIQFNTPHHLVLCLCDACLLPRTLTDYAILCITYLPHFCSRAYVQFYLYPTPSSS
jgi:hypothetical protein